MYRKEVDDLYCWWVGTPTNKGNLRQRDRVLRRMGAYFFDGIAQKKVFV
jgi:hypothetical protein